MTDPAQPPHPADPETRESAAALPPPATPAQYPGIVARGIVGGGLMGLANLVPGISGGTMLVATGVYPRVINAVAELSTLRFRMGSILTLGSVALAAGVAIAAFAGPVKDLVVEHRWIMYSLFIGLTLGGVPLVLRMARPTTAGTWIGFAAGVAVMAALAFVEPGGGVGGRNHLVLFFAGLAGAAAMILPGISGGYLLLVMGQYVPILASIDRAKDAVSAQDWSAAAAELHTFIPVGLGVVLGIVGVSNLIKVLLAKFPKPTLGVLLGLLVGAVLGLWPFQEPVPPEIGTTVKGVVLETAEMAAAIETEDWPTRFFTPSAGQALGAAGLIVAGFLATMGVSLLGRERGG